MHYRKLSLVENYCCFKGLPRACFKHTSKVFHRRAQTSVCGHCSVVTSCVLVVSIWNGSHVAHKTCLAISPSCVCVNTDTGVVNG